MDEHNIPYIVYESEQARSERHIKRLIMALVISIMLIFVSNALWLYAWMQYDYVGEEVTTHTVDVDAKDGTANYIGNNGDIVNGENKSYKENHQKTSTEESEQSWD